MSDVKNLIANNEENTGLNMSSGNFDVKIPGNFEFSIPNNLFSDKFTDLPTGNIYVNSSLEPRSIFDFYPRPFTYSSFNKFQRNCLIFVYRYSKNCEDKFNGHQLMNCLTYQTLQKNLIKSYETVKKNSEKILERQEKKVRSKNDENNIEKIKIILENLENGKELLNIDENELMSIFFSKTNEKKIFIKDTTNLETLGKNEFIKTEVELYKEREKFYTSRIDEYSYDLNNNIYFNCIPEAVLELYKPIGITWDNSNLISIFNIDMSEKLKILSVVINGYSFLSNIFDKDLNIPNMNLSILPTYYKEKNNNYVYLKPIVYKDQCEFIKKIRKERISYKYIDDLMEINDKTFIPSIDNCWNIGYTKNIESESKCTNFDYEIAKGLINFKTNEFIKKKSSDSLDESYKVLDKMSLLKFFFGKIN